MDNRTDRLSIGELARSANMNIETICFYERRRLLVETVTEETQTGQCACAIRNAQDSCCLGNVCTAVKRARLELETLPAGV